MQSILQTTVYVQKFVVLCHPHFNFLKLFFNWTDLHDIYGWWKSDMELLNPPTKNRVKTVKEGQNLKFCKKVKNFCKNHCFSKSLPPFTLVVLFCKKIDELCIYIYRYICVHSFMILKVSKSILTLFEFLGRLSKREPRQNGLLGPTSLILMTRRLRI